MMTKRTIGGAAASFAGLLMLSACGGVATQSSTTKSAADCGSEISIGAPYPLTGDWASNGQNSLHGMEIAAQQINAAGGIKNLKGAKLKIESADTSSDNPGQAKIVTAKLLDDKHMVAVVGSYLSSLTLTTVIATESAKVPLLTQSFVNTLTEKGYKYLFQLPPQSTAFGKATIDELGDLYKQQGKELTSVAAVGSNDASTKSQTEAIVSTANAAGLKVTSTTFFPNGLSDASAIVSKAMSGSPQVIVLGGNLPDETLVIKGLRAAGFDGPIATPGGGGSLTPEFAENLGKDANGVLATAAWNPDLKLPGVADAEKAYKAKYGTFMPQEAGESWVAVNQLADIVNTDKTCDPQKIRDALASKTFTSGPASALPPGKVGYDSTGANKYITPILVEWQNGDLKTVAPADVATVKALPFPSN